MRKAKVFNSHGCTTALHNALIDQVMPQISGNAWKLLCLVIRQTDGWNRADVGLSYRDLVAGMGVSSRGTVTAALEELKPLGLLQITTTSKWSETRYNLDLSAIVDWEPMNFNTPPVPKIGTDEPEIETEETDEPVPKIGTEAPVPKIVPVPKIGTDESPSSVPKIGTSPVPKIGTPSVPKIGTFNRKETNIESRGKQSSANAGAFAGDDPEPLDEKSANRSVANPPTVTRSTRAPIPEYESFAVQFCAVYGMPYQSDKKDFVQFAALKRKCASTNWTLTEANFRKALENYFASEIGNHTFADLCVRFSAFFRSPLDRYGKAVAVNGHANGLARQLDEASNHAYKLLFGEESNPQPFIDAEVL